MFHRSQKQPENDGELLMERRRHQRPFPPLEVTELPDEQAWTLWEEAVLIQETKVAVNALLEALMADALAVERPGSLSL